jgi:MarR family transcriptional regulator, 2-MHQ and catechol-resistance regulon repressor
MSNEQYQAGSLPEVFQLIEAVSKQLKRMQSETLKETGLTPPQYFVLNLLWDQDRRPFKELADLLNSSRATITEIVDVLERKELVLRTPNLSDRRSLLVSLTEKGYALRLSTPVLQEMFQNCCCGMDPAETKQLSMLLRKLNDALKF